MSWDCNGVRGEQGLPPIANNFPGFRLYVCGSGRSLWADIAAAGLPSRDERTHIMCVNFAGAHVPFAFHHWVSLHGRQLAHWFRLRREMYAEDGHIWLHSDAPHDLVEFAWTIENPGGCSGLFAAQIGLAMGYDSVMLCGIPEDNDGHFYDAPGSRGSYSNEGAEPIWAWARDHVFRGRVKSLSGRTRAWLAQT